MAKSKYPQELDSSIEIPPVRDNVLEIGSEVINSLRSAIFNIERTLGINPQGAVGNTVSERLNKSLDSNGNLKSDALSVSGLITGPIIDNDVSSVAAIQESKLKLNYPTTLLQTEISTLSSQLNDIITQVNEISTELSIHLNPKAINRHQALAISVSESDVTVSDEAILKLSNGDVQSTFERLINQHINYSGQNISETNNSHIAKQIFFDNTEIDSIIDSKNVQDAIVDLTNTALNSQVHHQNLMHSNGILKIGTLNSSENSSVGQILEDGFAISFAKNDGSSDALSTVTISNPITLGDFNLEKSDVLTITDSSDTDQLFVGDYEIADFTLAAGKVTELVVFGVFGANSTSLSTGRISKNLHQVTNQVGLLASIREEATLTSARSIQICNPNAVKVISINIKPYEITSTKRFIGIGIDGGDAEIIDLFQSSASPQTIDSVVSRINEQVAENALDFLAYRVDLDNGSELAIAYNLPDDSEVQHTLKISRKVDNGIDAAGLTSFEDLEIKSLFGTNYYINGQEFEGLNVKLDSTALNFTSSGVTINSGASGVDFLKQGLKTDDLIIISGAAESNDNGTYVIQAVTATTITLNSSQLPSGFAGTSQSGTRFRVYSNVVSFDNLVFESVGSSFGSALVDIFLDQNRNPFLNKRFEYTDSILISSSLFTLVDFDGEIANKTFTLTISGGTDLVNFSLDGSDEIEVRGNNKYLWIRSKEENVRLKFYVPSVGNLNTQITNLGTNLTVNFFGFAGTNSDSNLLISRVAFDNFDGRITGGEQGPRIKSILPKGNISIDELNQDIKFALTQQPISELRSNGVVIGLDIINVTSTSSLYSFDVNPGICYVDGRRFEINKQTTFVSDIDISSVDKIFIAIDSDGLIKVEAATPSCQSSFMTSEYCILGSIEYDTVNFYNIDLRLFINDLDLKLLNSITVSPEPGMAHFVDFGKAVKYAKRFSQLFTSAGVPTIHLKSGTHEITTNFDRSTITYADWNALTDSARAIELFNGMAQAGLILDFAVNVIGEGNSTILKLRNKYTFSDVTYNFRGTLGTIGNGFIDFTVPIDKFTSGFSSFKNFQLDNCRFLFPDMEITDGINSFFMGIDLDGLTFETRNFTANPTDTAIGPMCIDFNEVDNSTLNKGNFVVRNCKFLVEPTIATTAVIGVPTAARAKNIIIANNYLFGSDSTSTVRLLDKNIWFFGSADGGANITITGNLSASNFNPVSSGSKPNMVVGATGWGDRISRSLHIGGVVTGESSATFTEEVEGSAFNYNTTFTKTKNIFFESLSDTSLGTSGGTSFSTLSVNGRTWRTISFGDNTSDIMRVRLEVLPGETLTSVGILFGTADPADSIFGGFSLKLTSENGFGDETVEMAFTSMGVVSGGLGSSNEAASQSMTGLSFVGALNKNYIANIKRVTTTGFSQHMLSIQYTTDLTTVQAIGGLT